MSTWVPTYTPIACLLYYKEEVDGGKESSIESVTPCRLKRLLLNL